MRRLKKIAGKLVQLPKDEPAGELHAGPPFELPYTLNLPDRETERWRAHLDASRAAVRLVREQLRARRSDSMRATNFSRTSCRRTSSTRR